MHLMGLMQTKSFGKKRYVFVCVDDYSRFTWVKFLKNKYETTKMCINLCRNLQREQGLNIIRLRSDHGKEFENEELDLFCESEGITHEYLASLTPQQNGVIERKNHTLQEMAKVMLHAKDLSLRLWAEAMHIACHIHHRVTIRIGATVTLCELWKGKKPIINIFTSLAVFVTFLQIENIIENWMPSLIEGFF